MRLQLSLFIRFRATANVYNGSARRIYSNCQDLTPWHADFDRPAIALLKLYVYVLVFTLYLSPDMMPAGSVNISQIAIDVKYFNYRSEFQSSSLIHTLFIAFLIFSSIKCTFKNVKTNIKRI